MTSTPLFLTLIRGHQGSGKSTQAQAIAQADAGIVHIENDQFFTDENGVYAFDFSRHAEVKELCLRKTQAALDEGLSVVVSNTFTKLEELFPYIAAAAEHGAQIHVIEMEHDFPSVHGIPPEVIEQRKRDFQPWVGHKTVIGPQGVVAVSAVSSPVDPVAATLESASEEPPAAKASRPRAP